MSVDLPTLVYPTKATRTSFPRFLRCVTICLSILASCSFKRVILSRMIRLSVSISLSPGPRSPIPPFCLSKWVHIPVRRGSKYWYCASSTWAFASAVRALLAKISRIRLVRSRTFLPFSSLSRFLICVGLNSSSKMIKSMSFSSTYVLISSNFPLPIKVAVTGLSKFCVNIFTVSAPAVSARNASSSKYSHIMS